MSNNDDNGRHYSRHSDDNNAGANNNNGVGRPDIPTQPRPSPDNIAPSHPDPFHDLTAIGASYLSLPTTTRASQPGLTMSASSSDPRGSGVDSGSSAPLADVDVAMADPEELELPSMPLPASTSRARTSATPTISTAIPAPSAPQGARRARVEDEEDEEDIRERNRQRLHSPQAETAPQLPLPQQQQQPTPQPAPQPHNLPPNVHVHEAGPHRIVVDFVLGPPFLAPGGNPAAGHGNGPNHLPHAHQGGPHPHPAPGQPINLGQFFEQMRAPNGFFDMLFGGTGHMGEEPDDPERAQRLMAGLEEVPLGLVKRLERVGGNGEENSGPSCAICWESLLDGDGGFGEEDKRQEDGEAAPSTSATDQATASTSTTSPAEDGEKKYPKVVSLPCSHVFHASCLLPWFTRAHRTTCPSCRFDIDPDSLTYTPRMPRPMRAMPRRTRTQHPPPNQGQPQPVPGQPQTAPGAAPPPPGPGAAGVPDDLLYDVVVVDLVEDGDMPPDEPHEPSPLERAEAQARRMTNIANAQGTQGAAPPPPAMGEHPANAPPPPPGYPPGAQPLGFFDVSMAFSLVGHPPGNGTPNANGENGGGPQHFHIPYVFGGTFAVPAPQTAGGAPIPPVFGPAPPPPAPNANAAAGNPPPFTWIPMNPPASNTPGAQPGGPEGPQQTPEMSGWLDSILGGMMRQMGAQLHRPRGANGTPPTTAAGTPPTPATPAAPPTPPTAGTANAPRLPFQPFQPYRLGAAVPTLDQLFPGMFPPRNQPTGAGQPQAQAQPAPAAAAPPPQAHVPLMNPTLSANDRESIRNFFTAIFPGAGVDVGTMDELPPLGNASPMRDNPPASPVPNPLGNGVSPPVHPHAHHHASRGPKPQWTLPPPPGPTLRQRVEKREREMGLRCSDVSCGLGPTDEDPEPSESLGIDVKKVRQVEIRRKGGESETVCEHRFHCACLVSAERVAGWGGEKEKEGDEEVEVSCPVCRAVGCVTREEWEEGVAALV